MSDERLRALERRFRASGSLADEIAWLRGRELVGKLSQKRLQLAAHLGHPPARKLVSNRAPAGPPERRPGLISGLLRRAGLLSAREPPDDELEGWFGDPAWFEREAIERACVAMARLSVPVWVNRFPVTRDHRFVDIGEISPHSLHETVDVRPVRAFENIEGWVLTHTNREALYLSLGLCESWALRDGHESAASCASVAIQYTNSAVFRASDESLPFMAATVARYTQKALLADDIGDEAFAAQTPEARQAHWPKVAGAIRDELVPWALGYSDPVREALEARQDRGR